MLGERGHQEVGNNKLGIDLAMAPAGDRVLTRLRR
jgi:hypothetical protein